MTLFFCILLFLKCLLFIQTTTTTTRPVLDQRVYNERVTAPVHPEPVQPVHSSLITSKVTTENTQMRTENHELRMKVADLQMRVDRLLKGRDQVEAEGSGRFQFNSRSIIYGPQLMDHKLCSSLDREYKRRYPNKRVHC